MLKQLKVSVVESDFDKGNTYSFEFTSSAEELDVVSEQYAIDGPIDIRGTVVHTGNCYRVEGTVDFPKSFSCDRCLEASTSVESFTFSEEYKQSSLCDDKSDAVPFCGEFIDITELIRETILLSQPINNICSPECRGLCLKCGANLNKGECGCDRHVADPRLAALQKFFNK